MIFLAILAVSCGTHVQRTQVNDNFAYLQLVGKVQKEKLILNDSQEVILGEDTKSFKLDDKVVTKIRIKAGKNRVKILRGKQLLLDRVFYVSSGNDFELELP